MKFASKDKSRALLLSSSQLPSRAFRPLHASSSAVLLPRIDSSALDYDREMARDLENPSLRRKLKTLQTLVKRTEALATFLKENPALASDCAIKATMYGGQVSLYFEERAYINAVGSDPVKLRLQREVPSAGPRQEGNVCEDLSVLSKQKVKVVLRKVQIDLD